MRKTIGAIAAVAMSATLLVGTTSESATAATRYANCTQLRLHYHHGVARSRRAANYQVRRGNPRPAVRRAVYWANASKDADHDGTACEG